MTVGYQGWFSAQGDNSPSNGWNHTNLEMWPDQREYTVLNAGSGDAMEIPAFSTTAGTLVDQWTLDGGPNQQWAFQVP